jgi:hypothetical protein
VNPRWRSLAGLWRERYAISKMREMMREAAVKGSHGLARLGHVPEVGREPAAETGSVVPAVVALRPGIQREGRALDTWQKPLHMAMARASPPRWLPDRGRGGPPLQVKNLARMRGSCSGPTSR